jgi:hypothetical protein
MTRGPTTDCCTSYHAGWALFVGIFLAFAVVGSPVGSAWAAEPIDVENLIRQGVELRQKGRDHAALPLFQRAYDLDRSPRTAAQLGLAECGLGYWMAAERHLVEALASPRHPWVARNRPELEQTLKGVRASIGEVEIAGSPAGAQVLINGKAEGVLPLAQPIRVNDGMAQISVRAPGYQEKLTTVQVTGGKRERIAVALVPTASTLAASTTRGDRGAAPGGAPGRSGRTRAPVSLQGAPESSSSSAPGWVRPAAWVAGGLAVVSLSVGTYGYVAMQQKENEFNTRTVKSTGQRECNSGLPDKGNNSCTNIYNDSVAFQRLAINGLGAGALLAAASLVGFLWSAERSDATASAAAGAVASFDGDGFRAGWRTTF